MFEFLSFFLIYIYKMQENKITVPQQKSLNMQDSILQSQCNVRFKEYFQLFHLVKIIFAVDISNSRQMLHMQ